MFLADNHTHTDFSFDGHQTVDNLCESAIEKNISVIAITDHFDTDGIIEGFYAPYRSSEAKKAIFEAKEKYKNKIKIIYGIELGQPYSYPEKCKAFLSDCKFEYIIGSLHNLYKNPDFCFIKYEIVPQKMIESLWKRSIEEIYNLLLEYKDFKINTLAHLTYPIRYIKRAGKDVDMKLFYTEISELYKKMISYNVSLEVNTSGIRQGAGMTFPDYELIKLYKEQGGELITVGSDAHWSADVGADIITVNDMLKSLGYKYTAYYSGNDFEMITLN